jgi:hypothetical protein
VAWKCRHCRLLKSSRPLRDKAANGGRGGRQRKHCHHIGRPPRIGPCTPLSSGHIYQWMGSIRDRKIRSACPIGDLSSRRFLSSPSAHSMLTSPEGSVPEQTVSLAVALNSSPIFLSTLDDGNPYGIINNKIIFADFFRITIIYRILISPILPSKYFGGGGVRKGSSLLHFPISTDGPIWFRAISSIVIILPPTPQSCF